MKCGIIIYHDNDIEHNMAYIEWMITVARQYDMMLKLVPLSYISTGIIRRINYTKYPLDIASVGEDIRNGRISCIINRARDCNVAYLYECMGIRVYNNAKVAHIGNNKLAAYALARRRQIPYLDIYSNIYDIDENIMINEECNTSLSDYIIKPIYGHGGEGVRIATYSCSDKINEGYSELLQERLHDIIGDIRYYVINNSIIHAVMRTPNSTDTILSNYSVGGNVEIYYPSDYEVELVYKMIEGINVDYVGVDFLLDRSGNVYFNEIEDTVGSRMLSRLNINDTVDRYIQHIVTNS